jgi:hypothetical protein
MDSELEPPVTNAADEPGYVIGSTGRDRNPVCITRSGPVIVATICGMSSLAFRRDGNAAIGVDAAATGVNAGALDGVRLLAAPLPFLCFVPLVLDVMQHAGDVGSGRVVNK